MKSGLISIAAKIDVAGRYSLKGIALWRLGLISDDMWEVLETIIH